MITKELQNLSDKLVGSHTSAHEISKQVDYIEKNYEGGGSGETTIPKVLIYPYGSEGRYLRRDEVEKAFAAQFAYFEVITGSEGNYVEDIYAVAKRDVFDGKIARASFRYFVPLDNVIREWKYQCESEVDGTIYPPTVFYSEYLYDSSTNTYKLGPTTREFVYDETNDRFNEG